ncbi:MAG: hypothetical protein WCL50_04985 [Spirochaetota bacterium]
MRFSWHRRCAPLLAAAVLGLFSGCQQLNSWLGIKDPWEGYDSKANFVSNLGFDKQNLTATSDAVPGAWGVWTWAWMTSSNADATTFNYMTIDAPASVPRTVSSLGTVPTGLASDLDPNGRAYLLDLPNLLPAVDSDFEGLSAASTDWRLDPETIFPGTAASSLGIAISPNTLSGANSLLIELNTKIGASLNLAAVSDAAATGLHDYQLRLLTRGDLTYSFGNWGSNLTISDDLTSYVSFGSSSKTLVDAKILRSADFSQAQKTAIFFGSGLRPETGTVDNLRVLRIDLKDYYRLRLLLRPSDTTPKLARGIWSFVVWVLVPPGRSYATDTTTAANPFAASTVTLSMDQVTPAKTFRQEFPLTGPNAPATDPKAVWQRLEIIQTVNNNYEFDDSLATPVIELGIYPMSWEKPDAGGILIAQPELHFYLNGY